MFNSTYTVKSSFRNSIKLKSAIINTWIYRKYIPQIMQPFQYRYTQLQYWFAVFSESPSTIAIYKTKGTTHL